MVVVALRSLAASQPRLAGNPLLPHLRPRYPYPPRTNFRATSKTKTLIMFENARAVKF